MQHHSTWQQLKWADEQADFVMDDEYKAAEATFLVPLMIKVRTEKVDLYRQIVLIHRKAMM